jgi:hypothetical protein
VLAMFINRAKNEGLIEVLLPNMVDVGSFILLDPEHGKNVKVD